MSGWIKLHRKLNQWEWFQDSIVVHLFLYLLLHANHEAGKWQGIPIEAGQLVTGRKSLALHTGISQRSIRTALTKLKSTSELTIKTTNKYSIITIVKWDDYQCNDQQSVKQTTSKRPANDQQTTTNKNEKNEKNEKKIDPLPLWLPIIEWEAYKEMRNKIKKSMTLHAEKLAIKKLENFQFEGKNVQEILNYSILNNYQGIFEPKPQGETYGQPRRSKLEIIAEGVQRARAKREQAASEQTG